jgi:hypothetical protein
MRKTTMNIFSKIALGAAIGILTTAACFGQKPDLKGRDVHRNSFKTRSTAAPQIKAEYVNSYYIGYDLDTAKYYIRANETREALAQLAFLWDELYQQPEAAQVEAVMRTLVRYNGTADQMIARLELARASIEARLSADHKWFYSVGKNYSQMFTAFDKDDYQDLSVRLGEFGKLSKSAPAGTPADLVNALAKLGQYSGKTTFSDNDVAVLKVQWDTIDKLIGA